MPVRGEESFGEEIFGGIVVLFFAPTEWMKRR